MQVLFSDFVSFSTVLDRQTDRQTDTYMQILEYHGHSELSGFSNPITMEYHTRRASPEPPSPSSLLLSPSLIHAEFHIFPSIYITDCTAHNSNHPRGTRLREPQLTNQFGPLPNTKLLHLMLPSLLQALVWAILAPKDT